MKRFIGFCLLFLIVGTVQAQEAPYALVNDEAGIAIERVGLEEKVTGQAWGDYDNDGWLDLYLTDTGGANRLYRNNGDGTFSLSPLSEKVSLPDALSGGATFADFDNDGWQDLYVMNWGENVLFRNVLGTSFVDVTAHAGVGDASNGKTASWGDYNEDGFLDLYLANWACLPACGRPSEGDKDILYQNNGDGTFTDVTNEVLRGSVKGAGFVASFVDYDNDGDLDIYLVNDEFLNPIGNVLWRNDGAGCEGWCFTNVSAESGADTYVMGMGLATADYDQDGDLDFYFSNGGPMTLLQNQGDGTFTDVAVSAGVDHPAIGWGSVFLDYDNDGWQDLYLAVMEASTSGETAVNPLFHNDGDGTFTNLGTASGAGDAGRTIGVAYADYDQDGGVDLVIGNYDEGHKLYRNQVAGSANWVTLKLVGDGETINRDAVGARVVVRGSNGRSQLQDVINGASLGSGNALELYFGLGEARIDTIDIRWPDGSVQLIENIPHNERHTILYGQPFQPAYTTADAPQPIAMTVVIVLMLLIALASWGSLHKSD